MFITVKEVLLIHGKHFFAITTLSRTTGPLAVKN